MSEDTCPHCGHEWGPEDQRVRLQLQNGETHILCADIREPHETSCAVAVAVMIDREQLGARKP